MACASTGDTSAALAAYAAAAGIPAIVILPRAKVSAAQLVQPLANGALVLALDTDFDGCMAIVQRLAADEGVYLANSMNSLRLEGQKTLSIEIVQQFDWEVPDVVVIPGGNLGNVSALAAGFQMMLDLGLIAKRPRLVRGAGRCRQSALSRLPEQLGSSSRCARSRRWPPPFRSATPSPSIAPSHALQAFDGIVEQATEDELADASARADRTGMFNCPHTAVALAALEKLIARGQVRKTDRVIVVSTANGLKFSEFKTGYHTHTLERRHAAACQSAGGAARTTTTPCAARIDRLQAAGGEQVTWPEPPHAPPARVPLEVWKFGGASLASAEQIQKAAALDRQAPRPAGRRAVGAAGITDLLLEGRGARARRAPRRRQHGWRRRSCAGTAKWSARCCPSGAARRKLLATVDAAAREYRELCAAVGLLDHLAPRASDRLVSRGERMSAQILAAALGARRPPRGLRRRARGRRHRRAPRLGGAQPGGDHAAAPAGCSGRGSPPAPSSWSPASSAGRPTAA